MRSARAHLTVERSAGAVIFRRPPTGLEFLLLHYEEGHWDFPKGHVERTETTEETVRREVKEETGLSRLMLLRGFKETIRYLFSYRDRKVMKFVVFLLARANRKNVVLSDEHIGYRWLPYPEALAQVTFKNSRDVLEKAHRFLNFRPLKQPL